jgi:hypothetical protein
MVLSLRREDTVKSTDDLPAILTKYNNDNKKQVHRGRFLNICFALKIDEQTFIIKVEKGRIVAVEPEARSKNKPQFMFAAPSTSWDVYCQPLPPPGYQDVMAMVECGHAKLTGDIFPVLVNLFFVKGIVEGIRAWRAA